MPAALTGTPVTPRLAPAAFSYLAGRAAPDYLQPIEIRDLGRMQIRRPGDGGPNDSPIWESG
jgi:hypothetical protein